MLKTYFIALLMMVACGLGMNAQVTTEPSPLQEDSEDVTIFFHADQGNRGLVNQPSTAQIYAHTGVYVNGKSGWQYAPDWGDNSPKYKLEYVGPNLWKLYIGNIRTYYGVMPGETVTKLAFVFRTADNSKEGKGEGNTDILVDVVDAGLQIQLESNISEQIITPSSQEATFTASTTLMADMSISVNGREIGSVKNGKVLKVDYTFPGVGDYVVTAKAIADGESVETEKKYCYAITSPSADYPGGVPEMGPVKNADGSVTFCFGAPQKNNVMLIGEWNGYTPSNDYVMNYTDIDGLRYFWVTVEGLDNERPYGYYFLVDGVLKVGDPYARLVLDPWNDKYISPEVYPDLPAYPYDKLTDVPLAIYKGNINDYNWKVKNFKGVAPSDLIIYEMLLRDFTGTEGKADGNGTVRKAIEKIPYLKQLGINAVELLPIMEFNGNISWGYNPNFYFAPDKAYGTPDDYKEFIDLCHQNGIAVLLDMVFNQSDGLHPWYQMYMPGQNPFYNQDAPHAYSVLNDWNQGFPMVQKQWHDVLRYWMEEYKFDGFRFDLVKGLGDNDSYANNGDAATNAYNASRVARMKELQDMVRSINPDAYFINENLAGAKEENEMAAFGQLNWANINDQGCEYAMGYKSNAALSRFYAPLDEREWGSTVSYLESHDEQRLAYKQNQWGVAGVKGNTVNSMRRLGSAAVQMLLAPGAHMIWQFSELGNSQNTKNSTGGNDTDPKIVNWGLYDDPDHRGLYDSYAELIAIRNENKELFSESASFESHCTSADWENGRLMVSRLGDKELFTVINPNVDKTITVRVEFADNYNGNYQVLSRSYNSNPSFSASAKAVSVPANCYVVIGSRRVAGVDETVSSGQDNPMVAYARQGEIVVDYASGQVDVYASDGRKVGQINGNGSISVVAGVYILKNKDNALKLYVR